MITVVLRYGQIQSLFLESLKSKMHGRSSDLLLFRTAFPFTRTVAKVLPKHLIGDHSSGTVRDLHLIPYSFIESNGSMKTYALQRYKVFD